MKRICAWCRKELGKVDNGTDKSRTVTHGICDGCIERLRPQRAEPFQQFLNRLEVPVLLVESETKAITNRRYVSELFGDKLSAGEEQKQKGLIECIYAKRFGGCGNDVYCKTCALRNAVLETFSTGKSFIKIIASLDIEAGKEIRALLLEMSSIKVKDVVLLLIDDIRVKDE